MKGRFLIAILIFISGSLSGQDSLRFKKIYHLNPDFYSASYDVAETDFGYVLVGITLDTMVGQNVFQLTFLGVDKFGSPLFTKKYGDTSLSYTLNYNSRTLIRNGNNYYFAGQGIVNQGAKYIGVFMKLNSNFDTIWQKKQIDPLKHIVYHGITKVNSTHFAITGYRDNNTTNREILLTKIDTLGNLSWLYSYPLGGMNPEGRNVVYDNISNKYFVIGCTSSGLHTTGAAFRFDSIGTPPAVVYNYGWGPLTSIVRSDDDKFVACGNGYDSTYNGFDFGKLRAIKFDTSGIIIWSKEYGYASVINNFFSISNMSNGCFILAGQYDPYRNSSTINIDFVAMKLNQNGDSLWSRCYDHTGIGRQDLLNKIIPTKDSGFVATGYFPSGPNPVPFLLLKLDSLGCDTITCTIAVGTEEIKNNAEQSLNIYPNPSYNELNIEFNSKLFSDEQTLFVHDAMGKEVLQIKIQNHKHYRISTENLRSGIFFITLLNKEKVIERKKLVILH